MNVLVTGGAGFIGSNLCRRLLNEGHDVLCVDNFVSGVKDNLADFFKDSRFTFIAGDVTDAKVFEALENVERIYNLACPASPIHYQHNPVETLKSSVLGMMNMLDLALKTKARLLHTSTSLSIGKQV